MTIFSRRVEEAFAFEKKLSGGWNIRYPAPARAHSSTYLVNYLPVISLLFFPQRSYPILLFIDFSHVSYKCVAARVFEKKGLLCVLYYSPPLSPISLGVSSFHTVLVLKRGLSIFDS
ncbi:hypothetical protein F4811DRAFT_508777 [Daldinia bambusicola]|nr:hypothetical protein F4811DRAFT_508777 [Daldinia bambusicola]